QTWFRYFPQKQCLILESHQFYRNPARTLNQVCQFLAIPSYRLPHFKTYNAGNYPAVDPGVRRQLTEYFKPHNLRLKMLLGEDFGWDRDSELKD
ncbi:MAG: deacetylase sulfotransferase, partial [Oscillatoriales cyanobacterium RM1_1_9]|nr:deacetylase sulfotransferase [Oscillatoriales cyanobacterium RM1_1_9]